MADLMASLLVGETTDQSSQAPSSSKTSISDTAMNETTTTSSIQRMIPTLESICLQVIANNFERYPVESFALLAPHEFTTIVRKRYENSAPKNKCKKIGLSVEDRTGFLILDKSCGRLSPCISAKAMSEIQNAPCNIHLFDLPEVDELVWRDCVNLRFKVVGPSRPPALRLPFPIVKNELSTIAMCLLKSIGEIEAKFSKPSFRNEINRILKILSDTPMTISLLSETQIGRGVKKFVKGLKESKSLIASPSEVFAQNLSKAINEFNQILASFKVVASNAGVKMSKHNDNPHRNNDEYIVGKRRNTTDERHKEDLKMMESLLTWRALYDALNDRERSIRCTHGKKMIERRDGLSGKRLAVKEVRVRGTTKSKKASCAMRSGIVKESSVGNSRMSELRRQVAGSWSAKNAVMGTGNKISNVRKKITSDSKRSFAFQVANANPKGKSALKRNLKKDEINLGGGKKMRLPTNKANDVFSRERHRKLLNQRFHLKK